MIAYCNYIPRHIHTLSRYVPTAAIYLLLYSYSTLNVVLTVYTYIPTTAACVPKAGLDLFHTLAMWKVPYRIIGSTVQYSYYSTCSLSVAKHRLKRPIPS